MSVDNDADLPHKSELFVPPHADSDSTGEPGQPVVSVSGAKNLVVVSPGHGGGSLFEITKQIHAIQLALIDSGGELTPELEESISITSIAQDQKIDAYGAIISELAFFAASMKERAQPLLKAAKSAEAVVSKLRVNLKAAMEFLQVQEFSGREVRFSLRNSKAEVEIFDASVLPQEYFREKISIEPDLIKIHAAIKQGINVPGCGLIEKQSMHIGAPKSEDKPEKKKAVKKK